MRDLIKDLLHNAESVLGKGLGQIFQNDQFMGMVQSVVLKSLEFKRAVEGHVRTVLSSMNVPSLEDIEHLTEQNATLRLQVEQLATTAQTLQHLQERFAQMDQALQAQTVRLDEQYKLSLSLDEAVLPLSRGLNSVIEGQAQHATKIEKRLQQQEKTLQLQTSHIENLQESLRQQALQTEKQLVTIDQLTSRTDQQARQVEQLLQQINDQKSQLHEQIPKETQKPAPTATDPLTTPATSPSSNKAPDKPSRPKSTRKGQQKK